LMGAPRRTDMGPTFSNPDSPLYEAGWLIWSHMGAVGAVIMGVAMLLFFAVFFTTVLSPAKREPGLCIPTAEAYHDTDPAFLRNFTPWVLAAVVLLVIAYAPPLYQAVTGPTEGAPPYSPYSPVAENAR